MMMVAVPRFANRSAVICMRRCCLECEIVTMQPRTDRVPVPVAITTPLQQNWYCPVCELNRQTLPGLVSSCKHPDQRLTGNEQVAVLPHGSVRLQVTVV